jgi:predicted AlkP superfamily phosphohydrolase/phosphomutase
VADDKTLVVVVSDHGAKAKMADFNVNQILAGAGLLTYLPAEEGTARRVDWSRTRAFGQRTVHIYVNTKGRDPEGIVEPGKEYEQVREEVIKALHEYVDPTTGLKPIVLALTREDARILGHCDERSGDIIYAVDPRFYKEHGPHLPTAQVGTGDLRSLFIMVGPGVKKGVTLERTVWLTDIVPTVCHLAELPIPRHCEGAIVYQALEDPDAQVRELQSLRRNVERLKRMVERPPMR